MTDLFKTATGVSQSESWTPRLLSLGIHAVLVGLALVPWTSAPQARPQLSETAVALYLPSDALTKPLRFPARAEGGGGGGKRQKTPASLGVLPRGADKQLAPPSAEPPKNADPTLIVEPTIVAPQLASLRPLNLLNLGDPNGVAGPPSSGPGDEGGIGKGKGGGVGSSEGPGTGRGKDGGTGDEVYRVTGGVTAPTIVYRVEPEYSEGRARRGIKAQSCSKPLSGKTARSMLSILSEASASVWTKTPSPP